MKLNTVRYCLIGGLPMIVAGLGAGSRSWGQCWLAGVVLAAAFVPVALFGPRSAWGQFGVIAPVLLVVTTLCTWSEALIFIPGFRVGAVRSLAGGVALDLVIAVALALLAKWLKLTRAVEASVPRRRAALIPPLLLCAGIAYVVYYLVFGGITFQFFTKGYYPQAAAEVGKLGLWFWVIELGRGTLMTLAALPIILTLRLSRGRAALAVGLLLWVAGGLAPLLLPNAAMGVAQRVIHTVEIFTQNAALGVTAVLLLRRKQPAPLPT